MAIGAAAWLGLCGLGTGVLWSYAQSEGELGEPSQTWPLPSVEPPVPDGATLVLFAHPRCPCTSASMTAVERLMARFPEGLGVVVVFFEPEGADEAWRDSALWRRAESLRGAAVVADRGGRWTAAAGAMTSGIAGLYGVDGRLLYWGGLTPSRGHEGDSIGIDAVSAALRGDRAHARQGSVYGCPILGSCGTVCPEVAE